MKSFKMVTSPVYFANKNSWEAEFQSHKGDCKAAVCNKQAKLLVQLSVYIEYYVTICVNLGLSIELEKDLYKKALLNPESVLEKGWIKLVL